MNNLTETRKNLGMTQEEAAKALNVSRRSYQYYEKEQIKPNNIEDLVKQLEQYTKLDEEHGYLSLKRIIKVVKDVSKKHKYIHAVYLFGSYARGEATVKSDIDLLVVDDPIGLKSANYYLDLKEQLKKKIDITSYRQIDDKEFLKEILIDGIKIYGLDR